MFSYRILPLIGCALIGSPLWAQSPQQPRVPSPRDLALIGSPDGAPSPAAGSGNSPALLRQIDDGFVQVFEKAAPSVVVIDSIKKGGNPDRFPITPDDLDSFLRAPAPGRDQPSGPGTLNEASGMIIREDGIILTNRHVVQDSDKITVKLKDGRKFPAKLLAEDEPSDTAVLKIETKGLPVVTWADSNKVRVGQLVAAIGVPYQLEYSFTIGCISAKGGLGTGGVPMEEYIQTSALINPGNSGGPLLDVEGRVIGMNTLVNGIHRSLAFAIPSNLLQEISNQLIASGKVTRPALGIRIETLGPGTPLHDQIQGVEQGVVITTIEPGTPAYRSDLRPADVITSIDGTPVATAQELRGQVLKKKVGQNVTLEVWRGGKSLKINVATADRSAVASTDQAAPDQTAPVALNPQTSGLQLADVTQAVADRLGLKKAGGALVTEVDPESPAAIAGIQRDDVITEIDSKPVPDVSVARKLLENQDGKKALLLFVERKGQKTYAVLKNDH